MKKTMLFSMTTGLFALSLQAQNIDISTLRFTSVHKNFINAVLAFQVDIGFVPQKNCFFTGRSTILTDGNHIAKLQLESIKSLLNNYLSHDEQELYLQWLCQQNDPDSILVQRFLDMYSTYHVLYHHFGQQTQSKHTFAATKFALDHGRLPNKKEASTLKIDVPLNKGFLDRFNDLIQKTIKAYDNYTLAMNLKEMGKNVDTSPEKLEKCLKQLTSTSVLEFYACLEK